MRVLAGITLSALVFTGLSPGVGVAAPPAPGRGGTSAHSVLPTERALLSRARPAGLGRLYALNDLTHHVVRFDLRHGRWSTTLVGTGWQSPNRLAVTRRGVVWVVDAGAGTLVRVAANGRRRTVLGLDDPGGYLVTDRRGNAYLSQGYAVLRISASGHRITHLGAVTDATDAVSGLGVDAAGNATLVYPGTEDDDDFPGAANVETATFPAGGGAPVIRHIDEFSPETNVEAVQEAPSGAILIHTRSTGGSGYVSTDLYPPGAIEPVNATTKLSNTVTAFDSRSLLYVLQWRNWCFTPAIGEGDCAPDDAVDEALVYNSAGSHGTVPITGLRIPDGGFAADAHGRLYASADRRALGPLSTVPPGGGAAQPIIAGEFFALTVPYGR